MSVSPRYTEILTLLRKLKKDTNWLLNFILEGRPKYMSSYVNTRMTAGELLSRCSDQFRAKILFELKGIEKKYESEGYPKDFESIPAPQINDLPIEELVDDFNRFGLSLGEARILGVFVDAPELYCFRYFSPYRDPKDRDVL